MKATRVDGKPAVAESLLETKPRRVYGIDMEVVEQGKVEFFHATNFEFSDISSEIYRVYVYPSGAEVRIEFPWKLNVSKNGHRVFDESGKSHYIPQGWIHLYWEVSDGEPNFVK